MSELLYLSRRDVEEINLPMIEIIEALEDAFREKGSGRVEMPPKPGIHPRPDSFIHAMPAYVSKHSAAGMKWVSGFPDNLAGKLPYISGLLILNDPETGFPVSVMDCTWITAKRTGAATAVAAGFLARKDASTLGIVACGVQGRSNLEALACRFQLEQVQAFDIDPEVARRYAEEMSDQLNIEIFPVDSAQEAVCGKDLVVTSGPILKDPAPVIDAEWLSPGAFACPLDFDSYWKPAALRQIDKLATDDLAQLAYYRSIGYFRETPEPYADLGELAVGEKQGRQTDRERTMSLNLGLAMEDMVTAALIYRKARSSGIGTKLEL